MCGNDCFIYVDQDIPLYVPADSVIAYQNANEWKEFTNIQPLLTAEVVPIDKDTVYISPTDSSVTITWAVASADNYTIKIKNMNDTSIFYSFTFNAQGQVTHIACSPNRSGGNQVPSANAEKSGYRFTITDLDSETMYSYEVTTKDAIGTTISNYNGTFTTTGVTTKLNQLIDSQAELFTKIIRNGQLLILRDGKGYTATGCRL